jgi:hypothetical protein
MIISAFSDLGQLQLNGANIDKVFLILGNVNYITYRVCGSSTHKHTSIVYLFFQLLFKHVSDKDLFIFVYNLR